MGNVYFLNQERSVKMESEFQKCCENITHFTIKDYKGGIVKFKFFYDGILIDDVAVEVLFNPRALNCLLISKTDQLFPVDLNREQYEKYIYSLVLEAENQGKVEKHTPGRRSGRPRLREKAANPVFEQKIKKIIAEHIKSGTFPDIKDNVDAVNTTGAIFQGVFNSLEGPFWIAKSPVLMALINPFENKLIKISEIIEGLRSTLINSGSVYPMVNEKRIGMRVWAIPITKNQDFRYK